jgi:bifunctional UDP-N-acetylglucosamine pyrophosphorylase/glucosamine-1-phosphate N-acetyltransferase
LSLAVIVLIAGQGERTQAGRPGVTHPLAGRPMLQHVMDVARALEPVNIVVVAGPGAEDKLRLVRQTLVDGVTVVKQMELPEVADGTVLVLPGNMPLIRPESLQQALNHHEGDGAAVTVVGEGDIFCFRGKWLRPHLPNLAQASSGVEDAVIQLATVARDQGERVTAWPGGRDDRRTLSAGLDPLEMMHVDDLVKSAQAETEIRRRINERWMQAGVTLVHPEATYIDAGVEIGAETVIWPNTFLQGETRIGQACTLGPGSVIRDSTIGDGCRVELSVLEHAIMEEGSEIGPFGHLRRGAHLGLGVHMGNFGEVKNSYLGPGVKMGHFSYLGDATVGAGVNIGAGTITCNYDGQRKHRTVIGEDAFLGSDTMLVAPVEVGQGAKTGAGSVVTHDIPPGAVAYGVPARVQSPDPESAVDADAGAGS